MDFTILLVFPHFDEVAVVEEVSRVNFQPFVSNSTNLWKSKGVFIGSVDGVKSSQHFSFEVFSRIREEIILGDQIKGCLAFMAIFEVNNKELGFRVDQS